LCCSAGALLALLLLVLTFLAQVVLLNFPIQLGTGTACVATTVLMSIVAVCYIPAADFIFMLPYLCVCSIATCAGAVLGFHFSSKLGEAQIAYFVAGTLIVSGFVASVPSWTSGGTREFPNCKP